MSRSLRILNGHGKSMLPVAQALNFFVVVIESNGENVRQIDMDKILTISRMWGLFCSLSPSGQVIFVHWQGQHRTENKGGGNVRKDFVYDIYKIKTKWSVCLDEKKLKNINAHINIYVFIYISIYSHTVFIKRIYVYSIYFAK